MARYNLVDVLGRLAIIAGLIGVAGCASVQTEREAKVEVTIHCIVPDLHVLEIDGHEVTASRAECKVLAAIDDARVKRMMCTISITLTNLTKKSYLLSDWGFRAIFINDTAFHDEKGNVWTLEYMIRSGHPDSVVYGVPCVAGARRSFTVQLGLCRLVPATTQKAGGQPDFPTILEYQVKAGTAVECRELPGALPTLPSTIAVSGRGRCQVDVNGCR